MFDFMLSLLGRIALDAVVNRLFQTKNTNPLADGHGESGSSDMVAACMLLVMLLVCLTVLSVLVLRIIAALSIILTITWWLGRVAAWVVVFPFWLCWQLVRLPMRAVCSVARSCWLCCRTTQNDTPLLCRISPAGARVLAAKGVATTDDLLAYWLFGKRDHAVFLRRLQTMGASREDARRCLNEVLWRSVVLDSAAAIRNKR